MIRSRLSQAIVLWPEQAIALVGYMGWPNDPEGRAASSALVRAWAQGSRAIPPRLRQIQTDWARVADIFNIHLDLTEGGDQKRRGGPSIGKAIAVAAGSIQAWGAHPANLWRAWKEYKDVAHLVTAATIISAEVRQRAKVNPFGEFGLDGLSESEQRLSLVEEAGSDGEALDFSGGDGTLCPGVTEERLHRGRAATAEGVRKNV